jgi:crossover junction endodeoxyribonuclease RuvC
MEEEIILGIDPGTIITGFGLIKKGKKLEPIDFGCIKPKPSLLLSDRYHLIYQGVESIIKKYRPKSLAVETQFVKDNVQSAFKVGVARGVVLACAKNHQLKIFEYAPTKIKIAVTGNGFAKKYQVQTMVKHLLLLDQLPEPEDASDALACAICHANQTTHKEM